jgi:hypothetical protein
MVSELPKGKYGDIEKFGMGLTTDDLTLEEQRDIHSKIAALLFDKEAEEGGAMSALKAQQSQEAHEQKMRHMEELHELKVRAQEQALEAQEEASTRKAEQDQMKQEMDAQNAAQGQEMGAEPMAPPGPDPAQQQALIDAAYANLQSRKEGAYTEGFNRTLKRFL